MLSEMSQELFIVQIWHKRCKIDLVSMKKRTTDLLKTEDKVHGFFRPLLPVGSDNQIDPRIEIWSLETFFRTWHTTLFHHSVKTVWLLLHDLTSCLCCYIQEHFVFCVMLGGGGGGLGGGRGLHHTVFHSYMSVCFSFSTFCLVALVCLVFGATCLCVI